MDPRSQASQIRKRQREGSPGGIQTDDSPLQSPSTQSLPKVSLPRITTAKPRPRRASRACISCREQKAKCTGGSPCRKDLEQRLKEFYRLLRRIQPRADAKDQPLIAKALEKETPPASLSPSSDLSIDAITRLVTPTTDPIEEDFNKDKISQATGFIGAHSGRSWLHQLKRKGLRLDASWLGPETQDDFFPDSISSVNYFLDDEELSVDLSVQSFTIPAQDVADELLDTYFDMVHPGFPIVGKTVFLHQYRRLYSEPQSKPPKKWLAIFNLILAIAAQHLSLTCFDEADEWHDPSIYFSRGSKLGLADTPLIPHPDIQQAQIEGLAAFYLLIIGQVNRAWRISGTATRSAIAMGLHLRSVSKDTLDISKELRCRVWWSIFVLETTLSVMTGRPYSVANQFCTAPLPLPFDEDQFGDAFVARLLADANARRALSKSLLSSTAPDAGTYLPAVKPCASLYFLFTVELARIMRCAINLLYAPATTRSSSYSVEKALEDLISTMNSLQRRLPEPFQFSRPREDPAFETQRWCLAFQFYSAKMTIARIAIYRWERSGQATSSRWKEMSEICTNAACNMLSQLPNEPDIIWLSRIAPWCWILHDLMQALTVLLIELDSRMRHGAKDTELISRYIQKGMHWLLAMASRHPASERAWQICQHLYLRLTPAAMPLALRN
ncbi:putative C6 transcription factor [Aspergillus novofumigatus IBT 16806]|uniref:Putative C6 transcription factor n=1 Tax=Aspergillus novofumigatus (strain IBT 16806) TaxID=1392255 RepID=A0A2I1CBX7_ASPN1|nr:putative C6 transcription factor [Aspergillus novofumigatus IBT 16806]PKX95101.1 putative C6 transcription factor [Aspergillus novofumigatus IBT 16806]